MVCRQQHLARREHGTERAIPRVARGGFEAVIGDSLDRHAHGFERHVETGGHGGTLRGPGGGARVETVIDMCGAEPRVET